MEEEAPSRRSVAELAGRFKGSAPPQNAAGNETEKPVRRRPPRSLQLPKTHGDEQEQLPGVTSPLPAKTKRNSALIEKLQANLTLSPTALLPSPKSPGFRLMPPAFTPPSPGSAPVSIATTSSTATPVSPVAATTASSSALPLTEEEGPVSFETPPTAAEGSILSNSNIKGRARHSIRRRPPSRRHRKSSCGENVGFAIEGEDASLTPNEPEDKTTVRGEDEDKTDEARKDKMDTSLCPEKNESHQDDGSKISAEENEKVEGSMGGEEVDGSSSVRKEGEEMKEEEEEKNPPEKQKEDSNEGATNTDSKEKENNKDTTSQSSAS